eukprot:6246993-Prymnesium_polylepis.1
MAGAVRAKPGADDSPSGVQKNQVRDAHDVSVASGKGGGAQVYQKERRSKLANKPWPKNRSIKIAHPEQHRMASCRAMRSR